MRWPRATRGRGWTRWTSTPCCWSRPRPTAGAGPRPAPRQPRRRCRAPWPRAPPTPARARSVRPSADGRRCQPDPGARPPDRGAVHRRRPDAPTSTLQQQVRACLRDAGPPAPARLLDDLTLVIPADAAEGRGHRLPRRRAARRARAVRRPAGAAAHERRGVPGQGLLGPVGPVAAADRSPRGRRAPRDAPAVRPAGRDHRAPAAPDVPRPPCAPATATWLRGCRSDVSDEIGELARAFNRMADRREQLEEARRQLVSDVSHELRTPLANLRGWVEAARDGVVPAGPGADGQPARGEPCHLQRLVDDLHDLASATRASSGSTPNRSSSTVFLDQVATSFGAAAAQAGVDLVVECEPGRDRGRRPGAAAAGRRPTSSRTPSGTPRPAAASPPRGRRGGRGRRHRRGDPGGRAGRRLRAVPARRPVAQPVHRWQRARSGDRAPDRRGARRNGDRADACRAAAPR